MQQPSSQNVPDYFYTTMCHINKNF